MGGSSAPTGQDGASSENSSPTSLRARRSARASSIRAGRVVARVLLAAGLCLTPFGALMAQNATTGPGSAGPPISVTPPGPNSSSTPPPPPGGTTMPPRTIRIPPTTPACGGYGDWSFENAGASVWNPPVLTINVVPGRQIQSSLRAVGAFSGRCPVEGATLPALRMRGDMALAAGGIGGDYWKDLAYPIGVRERTDGRPPRWVTSEGGANDALTGSLTSVPLRLRTPVVSFLMGGGASKDIYVALMMRRGDVEALSSWRATLRLPGVGGAAPPPAANANELVEIARINNLDSSEELKRRWFDVPAILNAPTPGMRSMVRVSAEDVARVQPLIQVVVVDNAAGPMGHINVDDFRFEAQAPATLPVDRVVAGSPVRLTFDPDFPVWGLADIHTHPAAYHGFGGRLFVGDPLRSLQDTYATQVCTRYHGGIVPAKGVPTVGAASEFAADAMLHLAVAMADPHYCLGAPDYVGYPRFNVKLPAGYTPTFFRRAWMGGERLVVALAVNNQFLATRGLGTGTDTPTNDDTQMLDQLKLIKTMVSDNADFMEVALTPRDARRIILEGKLAVVLGIEVDNFGDFKDESYIWRDRAGEPPLVTLRTDDVPARRDQLSRAITRYVDEGARQFTPMHYIDGVFGGVPVMQPEPMLISQSYTNKCVRVAEGTPEGVALQIFHDYGSLMKGFALTLFDRDPDALGRFIDDCLRQNGAGELVSTINEAGLTPSGEDLFVGLMRRGMLIDTEHTSFRSRDRIFDVAAKFGYPLMSSHTDPTGLAFRPSRAPSSGTDPRAFRNLATPEDRARLFGTSNAAYLAREFTARDTDIERIRQSGGVVGMFTLPQRKPDYAGLWGMRNGTGRVRNNSDGSSKTFAQAFFYTADLMKGQSVAIASDRAGTEQIGPRFGVNAAWRLRNDGEGGEAAASLNTRRRGAQMADQARAHSTANSPWGASTGLGDVRPGAIDWGVRYDVALQSFHPALYETDNVGDTDPAVLLREDIWKAIAFIHIFPGIDPRDPGYSSLPRWNNIPDPPARDPTAKQRAPISRDPKHRDRIENFVRGWHVAKEVDLVHFTVPVSVLGSSVDRPWEEAAFFALAQGLRPCALATYAEAERGPSPCDIPQAGNIADIYWPALDVLELWKTLQGRITGADGGQAPLRRMITGTRHWDYNLDGMGNYGMAPDFLQDLRNVGVNATQMDVLFRSAEDYIRMWERAENAGVRVRSDTAADWPN